MFFDDIVSGNNWDYSQISHYVFEHLDKYQQLFLNYGLINRPQHIKIASVDSISLRTINNFGIDNIYLRSMFPSLFWIKYFFRVLHIGSIVTICNAIFTAKFTGELVKDHKTLYMAAGIVAIISGFVNTFLLKPKDMGENRKLWVSYHHIKLLTAIAIFTPLIKLLPLNVETIIDIQFYWMILALVLSPFARFYRQYFVGIQKEKRIKQINEQEKS